jgi:hypothetical protein
MMGWSYPMGWSYTTDNTVQRILSYIITPVAAERVAVCGGLLPKHSAFPI